PLGDLVARYARTHGPFGSGEVAARFGVGVAAIDEAVSRLLASGKLLEGAFLPGGQGRELCDAEVLRAIRGKSLAKLRREVEPVDGPAYGRFLAEWHALTSRRRGRDAIVDAIAQLQGCPV